jgi:hypothetical protein
MLLGSTAIPLRPAVETFSVPPAETDACGNAQAQDPEAGHKIPLIIAIAVIVGRSLRAMIRAPHVPVSLWLRQPFEKLPHGLLHLPLQVAPETLFQIGHKILEVLA